MGQHQYDATAWEVEAARRREVVRADVAATRVDRPMVGVAAGRTNGMVTRFLDRFAVVARALTSTPTEQVDDGAHCRPTMEALKPGG
jgi:hypothetical protein